MDALWPDDGGLKGRHYPPRVKCGFSLSCLGVQKYLHMVLDPRANVQYHLHIDQRGGQPCGRG